MTGYGKQAEETAYNLEHRLFGDLNNMIDTKGKQASPRLFLHREGSDPTAILEFQNCRNRHPTSCKSPSSWGMGAQNHCWPECTPCNQKMEQPNEIWSVKSSSPMWENTLIPLKMWIENKKMSKPNSLNCVKMIYALWRFHQPQRNTLGKRNTW